MKQGRRVRDNKEPKIKMTREEIELKKKKIKKKFFIFLGLILCIIIAFIVNDYIIIGDNTKTNLVLNNNNVTSNLKHDVIVKDGTVYLSKDDILTYFDKYIYLEKETNEMVTTYEKKIASIGFKENKITINGSNKKIYAHAETFGDEKTIYLPISEMKDVYGIEVEYIESNNVITVDSIEREQKKAIVAKNAAVKARPEIISWTVDRVEEGNYVVVVTKTKDGQTKIRTKNGKVGYVKNDVLANEVTIREKLEEEKQIQGKVNLVWDYYSEYGHAPDRSGTTIDGVNVVSPAFFYINNQGEFKENVGEAGKKYIQWAHEKGYKVWPIVSNSYAGNMLEVTSNIMNSYKKRQQLIEEIVDVCVKYKLDGINVDFENMKKADKKLFSRFIIELTPRIKEMGLVVSVDVTAPDGGDTWSLCFDRHVIGHVADYIVFMAYDQTSVGSSTPGSNAAYDWTKVNINKFLKTEEVKPEKLIIAVPFYTRLWTETSSGKVSSSTVNMNKIDEILPKNIKKQWLDDKKQNYAEYKEDGNTKKIWIEDLESIKAKMTLITENNLAGVAAWEKDREDPKVWEVIKNALNN